MDDVMSLAQAMGFAMQTIGLITVAIKTGNWKGITDSKIKDLESDVKDIRIKVESIDDRLDGVEKEFSKALVKIEANLEFIKERLIERDSKG